MSDLLKIDSQIAILEKSSKKWYSIALLCFIIGLMIMSIGFVNLKFLNDFSFPLFTIFIILFGFGIIIFYDKTYNVNLIIRTAIFYKDYQLEELSITSKWVSGKIGNIYLFSKKGDFSSFIIKFDDPRIVEINKTKLPPIWFKWQVRKNFENIKYGMKENFARIPINTSQSIEGKAQIYCIESWGAENKDVIQEFLHFLQTN